MNMKNDVVKNKRKKETTSLHCDIAQTVVYDIVCDIASSGDIASDIADFLRYRMATRGSAAISHAISRKLHAIS